ncbi:MAG: LLM class F420-dependent oxidoreductase [Anaerolineales bacterium]
MIEVALMVEGQNGLTWKRWKRMVTDAEDLGFVGLFRSDHFTNASPPDKPSLELWTSLTWLADNTSRIEFGPLVSPVSFRHPTLTARMAAAVDDLSAGRLILGLGAGWQEREHHKFGHDLLEVPQRFDRFEEGVEVITKLLQNEEPSTFEGEYFQIREAQLLPRPQRDGGPPILIGGNGPQRTLPLTARFADEWNGLFNPPEKFGELNQRLDELLQEEDREPGKVRRSLMTGCIYGDSDEEVTSKVEQRANGKYTADQLRDRGLIVGTSEQIVKQLEGYAEAGADRVMLQWLDLNDMDGLQSLAEGVLPRV